MANQLFSAADLKAIVDSATSSKDLKALATSKASVLCENIQKATALVNSAKGDAQNVKASLSSAKNGGNLLGMLGSIASLASSGTQAAQATSATSSLVNEAIKAITSSSQFATIMQTVLGSILKQGFTDSTGQTQQLNAAGKDSVNTILNAIGSFLKTAK
ncbi:MAG: hypothetical protein IJ828_10085 [Treponema sp.]|nr:hypothetical protein [Treponema sp.]